MMFDDLLVVLRLLERFSSRNIAKVIPADEELSWILVADLLELGDLVLA